MMRKMENLVRGLAGTCGLIMLAFSGWPGIAVVSVMLLFMLHPWRKTTARDVAAEAFEKSVEAYNIKDTPNILRLVGDDDDGRRWVVIIAPSSGERAAQHLHAKLALMWLDTGGDL